jgi:exocyst complex component 1
MHGITERYPSGQKADAAGFVRKLLDDLESRISAQFSRVSTPTDATVLLLKT